MLGWVIKWILISFSIIILLHHLYLFFINTLTIPKVKDLINKPIEQYNEINSSSDETTHLNDESNKLNNYENKNENENEFDINCYDFRMNKLRKILSKKRKMVMKIRGNHRILNNKFNTTFNHTKRSS